MAFSSIKPAINDFKRGKSVLIIDHRHRENEADLVVAAEKVTPEKINFIIKYARGLVCVPMLGKRLDELNLPLMVNSSSPARCAFTISVDYKNGSTGISAFDRAETIKALIDKNSSPSDFAKPGHVFPLRCNDEGLKKRQGHTEASIELAKLAGLYPAAVICEVIGESGRMARLPEIKKFAEEHDIKIVRIEDLIEFTR